MTEQFAAAWLSQREPHDHAARAGVAAELLAALADAGTVTVVDLGAGRGSNLRALAPLLGANQTWRLVDADAALLDAVDAPPGVRLRREVADLAQLDRLDLAGADLVTASAVLDLVSAAWLADLIPRLDGAAVLLALSYDGRIAWDPPDPDDMAMRDLVNRHQRTDKGFGPALGPDAADTAETLLTAAGYCVGRADTPWRLNPTDVALQDALLTGYADAAAVIDPAASVCVRAWAARRRRLIAAGRSCLTVGHTDLYAPTLHGGAGSSQA